MSWKLITKKYQDNDTKCRDLDISVFFMSIIQEILSGIKQLFNWWIIIVPWEQGIRIRLGKHIKKLNEGIHFRIPFLDRVYKQSTRLRYVDTPIQTITTKDGKTITLSGTICYCIKDVLLLYQQLHHPDDTIMNLAMSEAAQFIRKIRLEEFDQSAMEQKIQESLNLEKYGLSDIKYSLIDCAVVRTFRIINAQKWSSGDKLSTVEIAK